jgi:two-component system, chemotaxis family, sensor kinase Cph1
MGLQASMSVSLLVDDRLWGLISCGHRQPRPMPYRLRTACETIGRMVSLQIGALQTLELQRREAQRARPMRALVEALRHPEDHGLAGLPAQAGPLLEIAAAAGASVISGETVSNIGQCPDDATVLALSHWVSERAGAAGVMSTRQLPLDDPRWEDCAARASGVLGMMLPTPAHSCVLWFRPELVQTVTWGGNPNKPIVATGESSTVADTSGAAIPSEPRLHPRRSFAAWKQEVRGRSAPWGRAEHDAVSELRRSAIEIDLYRQVQREQAAVKARDDLVAVVAHDLRTPMSVVVMQAAVIERLLSRVRSEETTQRLRASAQVVQRAGQRMATLLNGLLDLARIEAGRFEVSASRQSAQEIIEDAYELLNPVCEAQGQELVAHPAPALEIHADPERLFQVLSNLIGNASKYSPDRARIEVKAAATTDGLCEFSVSDNGPGIGPEQLPRIFDRYWQERASGNGVGLGLYISRGIVEAHGGTIRAESQVGVGTTVSFTVPLYAAAR